MRYATNDSNSEFRIRNSELIFECLQLFAHRINIDVLILILADAMVVVVAILIRIPHLKFRIRNSEFRILGSEFRIRNSELIFNAWPGQK